MAEENFTLNFGENGASIVGAKVRQVTRDVEKMKDVFQKAFEAGNNVGASGSGSLFDPTRVKDFGDAVKNAGGEVTGFTQIMKGLAKAFVIREVAHLAGELVELVDEFTNLQNKIRAVSDSVGQSQIVMEELIQSSVRSRGALETTVDVYTRTARAVEELGKSQQSTIQFTETLTKAVLVGGSTSQEASNSVIQLAHGLSAGTLRARELRSVLTQMPVVAQLIADHFGIAVGKLREFSKAGKLTSEEVFAAIIEGTDKINARFEQLTPTFAQAWEVLKTKGIEAASALQPVVSGLAGLMIKLADNMNDLPIIMSLIKERNAGSFGAMNTAVQSLVDTFDRWIESIGGVHMALAKVSDLLINTFSSTNPVIQVANVVFRAATHSSSNAELLEDVEKRAKRDAEGRALMAMNDTSALDPRANRHPTPEVKPIGGKTFEDLKRELQDSLDVLHVGDLQIRPDGGNIVLPSQRSQADLRLAGPEDTEIAKKLESTIDQLGKKQPKLTGGQKEQLEDIIRLQVGIVQGKKDQAELEKTINKELDERLKAEIAIIELMEKKGIAAGQHESENMLDSIRKRAALHDSISRGLDPNADTKSQIQDLENFRDDPKTIREEALKAQIAIEQLTQSMHPLMSLFQQVSDSMVQGFSDAIARAIVLNENIGDLMRNLVKLIAVQAISGLVSTGLNAAGTALGAAITGANMPAPGAAGAGPSLPGIDLAGGSGVFPGHAAGGYTGNGPTNKPAGVVHGREYVLNAAATSSIGVQKLGALNSSGAAAMAPNITVHNNAAGDGYMARAEVTPKGEIQIMIDKTVQEKTPGIVAGSMSNRNSPVTKAMRQHFDLNIRNV